MLEGVKEGPLPGGLARTDARDGADPFFGVDVVDADCEDKPSMTWVSTRGSNGHRESLPCCHWQCFEIRPETFASEGGHATIREVEETLCHAAIPQFGISACLQPFMPLCWYVFDSSLPKAALPKKMNESQIFSTKGTGALLPM